MLLQGLETTQASMQTLVYDPSMLVFVDETGSDMPSKERGL